MPKALNRMKKAEMSASVVAFSGGSNWPIWVGQQQGFFAAHRLQVNLEFTPNSVEMVKNMMAGRYQLAMTAIDNLVAYQEGQGEIALAQNPDFFAFMGCDSGFLSVMADPDVSDIGCLRDKEVSVDAMTTGFAFVLREILARNGIGENELTFIPVGGGAQRLKALQERRQAATLLNTPLDLIAEDSGARRLLWAEAVIGPYQGVAGIARESWAATNGEVIIAYLRGYRDSVAWLYDRDNHAAALDLLVAKVHGMNPALAAKTYDVLLADTGGLSRDLSVDPEGMRTVLNLRSKFGLPKKALTDWNRYLDLRYHAQAF